MIITRLETDEKKKQQDYWPDAIFSASNKLLVTELATSDLNEVNNPLKVDYLFQLSDYITRQGKQVYVNMNIERELNLIEIKADRTIPIEVNFKKEHKIIYRLKIPDNMRVENLPAATVFNHPQFGFAQNYRQTDKEVLLETSFYLNTLLVEGKEISVFREMHEALKKAYRQTITLSEK